MTPSSTCSGCPPTSSSRSCCCPQGDFARFLRADTAERGDLLERLFDTGRFGRIEDWFADCPAGGRRCSLRDCDDAGPATMLARVGRGCPGRAARRCRRRLAGRRAGPPGRSGGRCWPTRRPHAARPPGRAAAAALCARPGPGRPGRTAAGACATRMAPAARRHVPASSGDRAADRAGTARTAAGVARRRRARTPRDSALGRRRGAGVGAADRALAAVLTAAGRQRPIGSTWACWPTTRSRCARPRAPTATWPGR